MLGLEVGFIAQSIHSSSHTLKTSAIPLPLAMLKNWDEEEIENYDGDNESVPEKFFETFTRNGVSSAPGITQTCLRWIWKDSLVCICSLVEERYKIVPDISEQIIRYNHVIRCLNLCTQGCNNLHKIKQCEMNISSVYLPCD